MKDLSYAITLDTDELEDKAKKATNLFRGISDGAQDSGNKLASAIGKAGAAFLSFSAATAFVRQLVQVRGEIESLEVSFNTLVGSAEKGGALFEEIKSFAVNTPMQLNDLAKGAQTLLGFNIEAEKVMPILRQIGDISMGDAQKFNSLTLAFAQMSSTGKLMGQDLLQMINAGFNPLTVIAEKTGKSVATLKDEMSQGAISVEMVAGAFEAATSEGGKFYNMLEKQSKTTKGAISNLQGAIDDALNELGEKSQGLIVGAVQTATDLVKNYETVGKVLGQLVIVYGSYKVALATAIALEKAKNAVRFVKEYTAMAKALGVATANQIAFNTAAMANPYVWVAIAVAGIAGLVGTIALWKDRTDETTESVRALEQAVIDERDQVNILVHQLSEANTSEEERRKILEKLGKLSPSLVAGLEDEGNAVATVTSRLAEYNEEMAKKQALEKQKDNVNDKISATGTAQAKAAETEMDLRAALEKLLKDFDSVAIKKRNQSGFFTKLSDEERAQFKASVEAIMTDSEQTIAQRAESIQGILAKTHLEEVEVDSGVYTQMTVRDIKAKGGAYQDFVTALDNAKKATKDYTVALRDQKAAEDELASKQGGVAAAQAAAAPKDEETSKVNNYSTVIKNLTKDISDLTKKLADLRAGKGDLGKFTTVEEAVKNASDELDSKKKTYKSLTGREYGKKDTEAETRKKTAEELKVATEEMWMKVEEAGIKTMEDGTAKRLKEIELEKAKTLAAIDKEQRELEEKAKKAGITLDPSVYTNLEARRASARVAAINEQAKAEAEQAEYIENLYVGIADVFVSEEQRKINAIHQTYKEQRKQLDEDLKGGTINQEDYTKISDRISAAENKDIEQYWTSTFGSYEQKLEALKNEWAEKMKAVPAEFADEANKQMNEAIYNFMINDGAVKTNITKLFDDITEKSVADLRQLAATGEEVYQFLLGGEWDANKGLSLGISKEEFETMKKSPEQLEKIRKAIKDINDQADKSDNMFKQFSKGLKQVFTAGNNSNKLREGIENISNACSKATAVTGFLSDSFQKIANASGNEAMQSIATGLSIATDAMGSAMEGAQAGAAFGPWGAAAGAAIGLVTSLYENIAKLHDDKIQARIDDLQGQIDGLSDAYDILSDSIEKAFGSDKRKLIEQQNENLKRQNQLIQEQINEEKTKKKSDSDAIDEWNKQIEENKKLIEENKEAAIDAIFGEDVTSAIENFSDAVAEAWANNKTAASSAKDYVKGVMKQMVQESIKQYLAASASMEKIRQALDDAWQDKIFTDAEIAAVNKMAEDVAKEIQNKYGATDKLFQDDSSRSAVSGSSLAASQESVDSVDARMTTMQSHTFTLMEGQKELINTSAAILNHVAGIHEDTTKVNDKMDGMQSSMGKIKGAIDEISLHGVKIKN